MFISTQVYPIFHRVTYRLRSREDGPHFPGDNFKCIFYNENVRISIKILLKIVPGDPIDNKSALVRVMAWRRTGHVCRFCYKMVHGGIFDALWDL